MSVNPVVKILSKKKLKKLKLIINILKLNFLKIYKKMNTLVKAIHLNLLIINLYLKIKFWIVIK